MKKEEKKPIPADGRTGKRRKRSGWVIVLVVILILALAGGYYLNRSPYRYKKALKLRESGNYEEAVTILADMSDYTDGREELSGEPEQDHAALRTPGAIVCLGSFEQDDDRENGKEPIEWIVLDVQDGRSLVISRYALDCLPYEAKENAVAWETCSLRKWLNNDFLSEAFSREEQKRIPRVTVTADQNPEYDTSPGKDTKDQVFLLSIPEAERYFASDADRACAATPSTIAKECYVNPKDGSCCWWLRSPGVNSAFAAFTDSYGVVKYGGDAISYGGFGLRPALWIDLQQ